LCEDNRITTEDLRLSGTTTHAEPRTTPVPAATAEHHPPAWQPEPADDDGFPNDLASAVAETERAAILKALEATRWNRTSAARQLGLTLRQLRYRLEKLGIE
jgi:two-component system response regulator PilR (NtrC family)